MGLGSSDLYLAVDIGGTKTAAALIDAAGQRIGAVQEPTCQMGPAAGIQQVINLLQSLLRTHDLAASAVHAIGIGIPAVLETGSDLVLWAPNLAGWRNVDLRGPLEDTLHRPVALEYDGHTAVLAEWWLGAGQGLHSFVNVIVGTGIGGGMVLEGRLVRGASRLAGAAGWFVLARDPHMAGDRERSIGFWEAQAAGPGIALRARSLAADYPASILAAPDQGELTASDVFAAADVGDALARHVLDETADLLGMGLANIVSLVNPQLIILGGGVGSRCGALLPRVGQVVERWAQPISAVACRLVVSDLGADAGLLGAAYSAMLRFA